MKRRKGILLFGVLLFPVTLYIVLSTGTANFNRLPYYGPAEEIEVTRKGKKEKEFLYHTIGSFSFTAQDGKTYSEDFFKERIYLVSFFNPNCGDHCAFANTRLYEVQKKFASYDSVHIVSFYIGEEKDSPPDLAAHAEKIHAQPGKWFMAKAEKNNLYNFATKGLLLDEMKDSTHTSHKARVVLVDKQGHIRGYYKFVKMEEPGKVQDDIKILIAEYIHPDKSRLRHKK